MRLASKPQFSGAGLIAKPKSEACRAAPAHTASKAADGAAKSDADHLVHRPSYGKWFDMKRDWGCGGAGSQRDEKLIGV
jgi:hypothetical protein